MSAARERPPRGGGRPHRLAPVVRTIARAGGLARLAWGLPAYARRPLDLTHAADAVERRLAARERIFLTSARQLIYDHPASPYRQLLQWAGCAYADLCAAVGRHGIEGALRQLRDAGVHVTHAEFAGTEPLRRPGLTLALRSGDFDNPQRGAASLQGATSGSRSEGIRVIYSWEFLAEEVANELLLHAAHGVDAAPLAYWMPMLPALSGMHNALIDIGMGRPPLRWFSQVDAIAPGGAVWRTRVTRSILGAAQAYVQHSARRAGVMLARPEHTPLSAAQRVAAWLAETRRAHGAVVMKAFTSSAVRIAAAARDAGIDLRGVLLFTGGEALSPRRRDFIESSGAAAMARYVTTEAGLVAGACPARRGCDDMHVYLDRLALVPAAEGGPDAPATLLFTSLSAHAGKVLLNTDLGDVGRLDATPCGCRLAALGYGQRLSGVRAHDKLTAEGMTVPTAELDEIVGALVARAGGGPDDYQFWVSEQATGIEQVVIAIDPAVPDVAGGFARAVLDELTRQHLRGNLTGQVWGQADCLRIVREPPRHSPGQKLLRRIRITDAYASGFSATTTSR